MKRHALIERIIEEMGHELSESCYSEYTMQDEYEYMYDTDDSGVFVILRHEGGGMYKVTDVIADSRAEKKHPNIEAALKGIALDLGDVYRELETDKNEAELLAKDPYAYYGVSRWDFV